MEQELLKHGKLQGMILNSKHALKNYIVSIVKK